MFNESLNSWLYSDVQEHRTCDDLTNQFKWLVVEQFLDAIFFMLVMDNLNTLNVTSLYQMPISQETFLLVSK